MAKIPLRTYNREIEGMIDRGQAAQAISHCRHILKFFPKHIDTYRLLGKAFLELQRYAEAADVLERVLACVPDDFISQIGMGIIREDEGNLDAAIWHMERAFEAQPSNVGVQVELRRLHGRRDGVEPAKIRLTRGALVRMYARGELFQQAIAEARAALAEDPNRADLEVILARMYFLSGQKVAATEVCTRLLARLPFCFEANRILAEILPGTTRAEDAKLYLQRVYAMDPYLAHLTPQIVSSSEVPDNAVELEHLEWLSEQEVGQPPDWTKSLGASWTDQAEPIPEWITGPQQTQPSEEPPVPAQEPEIPTSAFLSDMPAEEEVLEEPAIQSEEEAQIPAWMQQAGWQPANGEVEETGNVEATADESPEEEETPAIEKAEIPDWLAAIAPPEQEPEVPEIGAEQQDWMADILSTGNEELPQSMEGGIFEEIPEEPLVFDSETVEETPAPSDLVEDEYPVEPMAMSAETPAEAETPEPVAPTEVTPSETETPEPAPFTEEPQTIPDYFLEETTPQSAEEKDQVPEWMSSLQDQQPETSEPGEEVLPPESEQVAAGQENEQIEKQEEELPEWLKAGGIEASLEEPRIEPVEETGFETSTAEISVEDTQPTQIKHEETPAPEAVFPVEAKEPEEEIPWLESFDVEKRAEEEAPATPASEGEELPDWVQEMMGEQGSLGEVDVPEEQQEFPQIPTEEITFERLEQAEQPVEPEPSTGFYPEWLSAEPAPAEPAEAEPVEAEPSDLESRIESETPVFEEQIEEPQGEIPTEPAPTTAESDEAFAWLENLAAKQGADEETLLSSPEQRQEELPAWIKEQPEEAESSPAEGEQPEYDQIDESGQEPLTEVPSTEAVEGESPIEEIRQEAVLDFDQEPSIEMTREADEAKQPEEALPDWLKELSAEEELAVPEKAPEEPQAAEESLGWLEELTLEEAGITPTETIEEQAPAPESAVEAPAAFTEDESILSAEETAGKDVLPDWLKGLEEEKSKEEPLPVFGEEGLAAGIESSEDQESWIPEMAAEASADETASKLEDTSPVRITPQAEAETSIPSETIKRAQEALEAHNVERALDLYDQLIKSGEYLEDTIHDLRDALYRYPIDVGIWQALGDACMKDNRLQEALDAYTKAEELLR